jgi:hypothetical protein
LSSFWLILKQQWTIKISSPLFSIKNIWIWARVFGTGFRLGLPLLLTTYVVESQVKRMRNVMINMNKIMWSPQMFFVSFCHHLAAVINFHILIFSSETTWPIATKLWWNGPWMAFFQNCVRWSRFPTKMAAKLS